MATESDNVNSGALGTLVAVGTIAFFGIALVVTALVRAEANEEAERKEVRADRAYVDLVNEQRAKLAAPASFVDRARGLVSLPIDRAMELTVSGLKNDPNSATPPASPAGGAGGSAATGAAGGTGGSAGGTGGSAGGTGGAAEPAKPTDAAKPAEGAAPKPVAPVPAAPAPAPAPAAPNGQ